MGDRSQGRLITRTPCRTIAALAVVTVLFAPEAAGAAGAQAAPPGSTRPAGGSGGLDDVHAGWTALLERHVDGGNVDYDALRAESAELDAYSTRLASVEAEKFAASTRSEQLAFWINAYNAFTVRLVLAHWPVDGIWSVTPLWRRPFGGPFAVEFIPLGHLAPELEKRELSLDDVEHEILRARFAEPRIHFAVVCAARGCPPLASRAYAGATLDADLDAAARRFLAQEAKNRFEAGVRRLVVSPIFRWFAGDFAQLGGPRGVFLRYGPPAGRAALESAGADVEIVFSKYDWGLNGSGNLSRDESPGAGTDNSPGPRGP